MWKVNIGSFTLSKETARNLQLMRGYRSMIVEALLCEFFKRISTSELFERLWHGEKIEDIVKSVFSTCEVKEGKPEKKKQKADNSQFNFYEKYGSILE